MNNAIKFSRIIGNNALFTVSNSCFWALKCQVLWLSRYMTLAKSLIVSIFKFIKLTLYTQPKIHYIYMHTHKHVYKKHLSIQWTLWPSKYNTNIYSVCALFLHQNWSLLAQCVPALDMEVGNEGIVGFGDQRQNLFGNIINEMYHHDYAICHHPLNEPIFTFFLDFPFNILFQNPT